MWNSDGMTWKLLQLLNSSRSEEEEPEEPAQNTTAASTSSDTADEFVKAWLDLQEHRRQVQYEHKCFKDKLGAAEVEFLEVEESYPSKRLKISRFMGWVGKAKRVPRPELLRVRKEKKPIEEAPLLSEAITRYNKRARVYNLLGIDAEKIDVRQAAERFMWCPICKELVDANYCRQTPRGCSSMADAKSMQCINCKKEFCIQCFTPWHEGESCEVVQGSVVLLKKLRNNKV